MKKDSKEAGWLTGYQTASETDYESNFEIFKAIVLGKVEKAMKKITFFVEIDQDSFNGGVEAGIKACYNDCVNNGAVGELQ